ncbi:MAG: hypothetical protein OXU77_11940 [Gammaproteobacteria bacterium]|nr:hypothetical protein [Gammaproteobacteria bacterium]MDE0178628.1 hypothetical protein [Gammaproteobacteria bacterium]MDE0444977.1 hypothetical protein [Gammaproteobacteria bacterium]
MQIVIPRLAKIAMLGLFTAGLAMQSLHMGHDLVAAEAVECACAATDRPENAVDVLPAVVDVADVEIPASAPVFTGLGRASVISHGARAPPLG